MNYFTPAWHCGDIDDDVADTAFEDYRRHLAALTPSLPPDVQALGATNLHDGLLWSVGADASFLGMTLRCGDLQVGYFDVALDYFGVLPSAAFADALAALAPVRSRDDANGIAHYAEALYDEIDRDGEWLVHRMLFIFGRNYHELTVRFKELAFSTHPRTRRYDTDAYDIGPATPC